MTTAAPSAPGAPDAGMRAAPCQRHLDPGSVAPGRPGPTCPLSTCPPGPPTWRASARGARALLSAVLRQPGREPGPRRCSSAARSPSCGLSPGSRRWFSCPSPLGPPRPQTRRPRRRPNPAPPPLRRPRSTAPARPSPRMRPTGPPPDGRLNPAPGFARDPFLGWGPTACRGLGHLHKAEPSEILTSLQGRRFHGRATTQGHALPCALRVSAPPVVQVHAVPGRRSETPRSPKKCAKSTANCEYADKQKGEKPLISVRTCAGMLCEYALTASRQTSAPYAFPHSIFP